MQIPRVVEYKFQFQHIHGEAQTKLLLKLLCTQRALYELGTISVLLLLNELPVSLWGI